MAYLVQICRFPHLFETTSRRVSTSLLFDFRPTLGRLPSPASYPLSHDVLLQPLYHQRI